MDKETRISRLEKKVEEHVLLLLNELYDTEYDSNTNTSSFIITFVRDSEELNPKLEDLETYGVALVPKLPVDSSGNLLTQVSLSDTTVPLESRFALALRHLWSGLIPDWLGQSPCALHAGEPPSKPEVEATN